MQSLRCRLNLGFAIQRRAFVSHRNLSSLSRLAAYPITRCFSSLPTRTSLARYKSSLSSRNLLGPTIYALSTAPGRAAIAVIRCSGGHCQAIYEGLCPNAQPLKPRHAAVRKLVDPVNQEVLDSSALVLGFPGPKTATGEDVLELHVHGGPAIIKAVLAAIPKIQIPSGSSIRYAEPGEFTRRAFYNDRLDLTQVEALGDSLSAETEQQRRLAVSGMSNNLHGRYEKWRTQLLYARGELEALIDFSEDQHFDESAEDFVHSISEQIRTLVKNIDATSRNAAKGELLRHGIKIALFGEPNAGKSSLLNAIVRREAAIVSSEAGTTRDVIEVNVDIGGFFCRFNDLAGVRSQAEEESSIGEIEKEGITRAKAHARDANVVIVVVPCKTDVGKIRPVLNEEILDFVKNKLQETQRTLFAISKSDLAGDEIDELRDELEHVLQHNLQRPFNVVKVSCLKESGLHELLDCLTSQLTQMTAAEEVENRHDSLESSLSTTVRQQSLLNQAAEQLNNFLQDVKQDMALSQDAEDIDVVLAAERLRIAADCLAKITGRGQSGDVEEVLGVVFEKFCVGK